MVNVHSKVNSAVAIRTQNRRKKWLEIIDPLNKLDLSRTNLVCSKHFVSGSPVDDCEDVDWVPSLMINDDNDIQENNEEVNASNSKCNLIDVIEDDHIIDSVVFKNYLEANTSDVQEEHQSYRSVAFLESEILHLKLECEKLKEEKTRFMDQLKDSSNQILELTKEVKNLDQINQQKIADTDISKFIINNDKRCKFYTGIDSYEKLIALFDFIEQSAPKPHPLEVLTHFQQFVLTLVKLRLNLRLEDLGHRFNIAKSTVSKYVHIWVTGMYQVFVPTFPFWPGEREVKATLPMVFREHFERCISIIDCFEIFVQRSTKFKERTSTFSSYKHHNTIKYLISLTPQGTVSFISLGYGGRCSDKFIVEDSGYIDNLKEGYVVLADRGFLVNDLINLCDAELKTPAFKSERSQLSQLEVEKCRTLSKVRIHVERVIGTLKQRFSILSGPLHHEMFFTDEDEICFVDKIVKVASALNNCNFSIVPRD
ncbi:uncharacterized protein LOC116934913 isoform X2 [Daphnia magna]|uniref:uncharacterized protein LOC116934913 isoform X2 n=1 Tax=Daphnia magna TaxID=35525 RepID=UPI001E1BD292|nr:uncharacterized protein LOC116934913 isoform X2 [Daphnia magna]